MYSDMVTLQVMDIIFYEAQRQGRISFYLTTIGEEAINIAFAAALTSDDSYTDSSCGWSCLLSQDGWEKCMFCDILWRWWHYRVIRGQAYGIHSIRVDGNDALVVYSVVHAAREMVISEYMPILVEALTYRVGHHSTSDLSTKYRPIDEIEHWRTSRDPVSWDMKLAQGNGWWSDADEAELRSKVMKELLQAIQVADRAQKSPLAELFSLAFTFLSQSRIKVMFCLLRI